MLSASAVMLLCGLMASVLAIRIAIPLAHRFDVVDRPGGHKQHEQVTPFIGGVGVFLARGVHRRRGGLWSAGVGPGRERGRVRFKLMW